LKDGKEIEIEDEFEWCVKPVCQSLGERARNVFVLSLSTVLGEAGLSSKGDATLYKSTGGSAPKSCEETFNDR